MDRNVKILHGCLISLVLLSGCSFRRSISKSDVRVLDISTVRRADLVIPSAELGSVLSTRHESKNSFSGEKARSLPALEHARQCEAKLIDIPVPIAAKIESAMVDAQGNKMLTYSSGFSYEELGDYYKGEMERFGWRKQYSFEGNELLFSFEKPNRTSIVSIYPIKRMYKKSKKSSITIFVSA